MDIAEVLQTHQDKWVKEYGRIYRTWIAFRTFVHISTPHLMEVMRYLLKFECSNLRNLKIHNLFILENPH